MTYRPVPIGAGSYADDARSWVHQDCLNLIPVNAEAEGTRSPTQLVSVPGLQEYAYVPDVTRQRGARNVEGRLYFVAGESLCQLLTDGSVSVLGTIPGRGRVSMSHNQISGGNELFIATGSSAYIWNTATEVLTQITDSSFGGATVVDFIAQVFVFVDPSRREFGNSSLADGLSYNALETYQGESSPDRIRALKVVNNEVVLLNERTLDHFQYTGTVNALFENKGISIQRGSASTHAVSVLDNALFFIGDDGSGYEKRGYELRRITTHAIEQAWKLCDWTKAYSFVWEDEGHKVWYVTFPDGFTWGYDVATRKWHRRSSYGMDRWRLAWLEKWNGEWYGGEFNSGRVFRMDKAYPREGGDVISKELSPGVLHKDGNRATLHAVRMEVEVGPSVEASGFLPLRILSVGGNVPDGVTGTVIDYTYQAVGGQGPYTFSIDGSLPPGLSLDGPHVTGTYTTAGSYGPWTIQVTDANADTATIDDSATVLEAIYLTGDAPDTQEDIAYSYTYSRYLGTGPFTFTVASGALPTGVTLNASTGQISGTPTTPGTYTFTIQVEDSTSATATLSDTIEVTAIPVYSFNLNGVTNAGTTSAVGYTIPHTFSPSETLTMWVTSATYLAWQTNAAQPWLCEMSTTDPSNGTLAHFAGTQASTAAAANALAVLVGNVTVTGVTGSVVAWLNDTPVVDNAGGLSISYTIT